MSHGSRIPAVSIQWLRRPGSWRVLLALLALTSWPLGPAAEEKDVARAAPPNAHMTRYGDGWECDRGYRSVRGACVGIQVPANAYLDATGRGWRCDRGYRKADEVCVKLELPPHAFLDSLGNDWKCDRGYRRVDDSCVAIALPENAFLDSSGS